MQEVIRKEPIPRLMRLPFTDSREICGWLLRTLGVQKKKGIEQRFFVLFKDVFQQDTRLACSCADATSAKDRLDYFATEADEKLEPRGRLTLGEVEKLEARPSA